MLRRFLRRIEGLHCRLAALAQFFFMPQRRLILGIVDHQRAVFGQKLIGVHDPRRKHHQREGILGEAEAAVVEVEDAALGKIAVFVSNLHLLRVLEEVLVRLGLLHRIDQPRILLRPLPQRDA